MYTRTHTVTSNPQLHCTCVFIQVSFNFFHTHTVQWSIIRRGREESIIMQRFHFTRSLHLVSMSTANLTFLTVIVSHLYMLKDMYYTLYHVCITCSLSLGFYETERETLELGGPVVSSLINRNVEGDSRDAIEARERRKDREKQKKRKENDLPTAVMQLNRYLIMCPSS